MQAHNILNRSTTIRSIYDIYVYMYAETMLMSEHDRTM